MKHISELHTILSKFLNWHKSRLDCFTRMLLALFVVRTINLSEISSVLASDSNENSRYKRCKRFFAQFEINVDVIARWVFQLFFSDSKELYLSAIQGKLVLG